MMIKRWEENLVGDGYVYDLDVGNSFMCVYLAQTHWVTGIKYVQLSTCQHTSIKWFKNKIKLQEKGYNENYCFILSKNILEKLK